MFIYIYILNPLPVGPEHSSGSAVLCAWFCGISVL